MKRIALQKQRDNIAEYVIYMYQMEDLIRSYQFNMADLNQYVISHYPIAQEEKSDLLTWFSTLAKQMTDENIRESGHLSEVQQTVDDLAVLHWRLLKSDPVYFETYTLAKPHVMELVLDAGDKNPGHEIQVCFNGIYGRLLSRLHGRDIPQDMLAATDRFAAVIRYLTEAYHQRRAASN
nr:DUF4924 family protein [Cytophagales bacterium]